MGVRGPLVLLGAKVVREARDSEGPKDACQCVTYAMMALRELVVFATDEVVAKDIHWLPAEGAWPARVAGVQGKAQPPA